MRAFKRFAVTITLITPYMQHRMDDTKLEEWEKKRKKIIEREEVSKQDNIRANYHSFFDDATQTFYMPSDHIRMSLIGAGGYVKSKVGNARKSMKNVVAAMFTVIPEKIVIPEFDEIDKRSAVNKNVKARVMVVRPKWNKLEVSFEILIDDDTITKETVEQLLDYSGRYVGIGSYRPEHTGSFGRYEIKKLEEIKEAKGKS